MRTTIQTLISKGKDMLLNTEKAADAVTKPEVRQPITGGTSASRVGQFNAIETMVEIEIEIPKMRTLLDQMERQLKDAVLPGSVCRAKLNPYFTFVARKEARVNTQSAAELQATAQPPRGSVNQ